MTLIPKISQRNSSDCGVCCIAMLLDVTYEKAARFAFGEKIPTDFSIKFELLKDVFAKAGRNAVAYEKFNPGLSRNGLLEISYKRNSQQVWHYVVYDAQAKMFIDPQNNPPTVFSRHRFLGVK